MIGCIGRTLHKVFDPVWLTGPIFSKELRVASRRRRQFALRSLYILVLALFAGVVWLSVVQYQGSAAFVQSRMAEAGKKIISTIVLFQFCAMQVLAVVLLSSAVSDELYHRTLGTLMTTPITGVQIVLGKLLSRLLQLVLLLAISLPLLAIIRVLGGVPWGYLLASLCVTLTAALLAGSVSLLLSIRNRHAYAVIMRTMVVLAGFYFGLPSLLGFGGYYILKSLGIVASRSSGTLSQVVPLFVNLNPFSSMLTLTTQMLSPGAPMRFVLPLHCGLMLGLSALVLGWAVIIVRRVALRQAVGISDRRVRIRDSSHDANPQSAIRNPQLKAVRRVMGPPVVWKELRAPLIQGIDNRNSYIGLAVTIVALVATYLAGVKTKSLDADFTHVAYVALFVFIGSLINVIFSATRITAEKESQAWSLLLTTPLSDWDILLGKAVSAFRRCLPIWGLLVGHVLLFMLVGYIHPAAALHLMMLLAWLTCFLTGAGLYFSARFARTTPAVVATFALTVGLWVVGPTLAGLVGDMGGKKDVFSLYMWIHPAIQTEMITVAAAGSQNAGLPWGSLNYTTVAIAHDGRESLGVGAMTGTLAGVAGAYIVAGLLFFWRAKCWLRRRIFG